MKQIAFSSVISNPDIEVRPHRETPFWEAFAPGYHGVISAVSDKIGTI